MKNKRTRAEPDNLYKKCVTSRDGWRIIPSLKSRSITEEVVEMFEKIVAIEPVGIDAERVARLKELCKEYVEYADIPQGNEEIIRRIGDADCVLVSFTSQIDGSVIEACPAIRYIGMCCSLYDEKSANVDIAKAREKGIVMTGIRDYGDNGVIDFVVSELVRLLHGFGPHQWKERPTEITDQKVGILGLGTTGTMLAHALQYFGAQVCYYSRSRKPEQEAKGIQYMPLEQLLEEAEIVCTCLNKNVILLHEKEFQRMGDHKILVNTGIGPSFEVEALKKWLQCKDNYYICDDVGMGALGQELDPIENVLHTHRPAGSGVQCTQRLSQKVVANIEAFLNEQ